MAGPVPEWCDLYSHGVSRSPAAFSAFVGRASGALSARRGVPRRA